MGQIRREHPQIFEDYLPAGGDPNLSALNIRATIATEVLLAKNAYAKAAGSSTGRISQAQRLEYIDLLGSDYRRYGLSTGPAKSKELIRDFERAAVKQLKQGRT